MLRMANMVLGMAATRAQGEQAKHILAHQDTVDSLVAY